MRPLRQVRGAAAAGEQAILFRVGGFRFAIAAAAVEEIRGLEGLQQWKLPAVHPQLAKVRYAVQNRQRACFVVDSNMHFRILPSRSTRMMVLRASRVAVLVDEIERMASLGAVLPLPRAFGGEERRWYKGLALLGEDVVPVVNPAAFLSKAELAVLEAARRAEQMHSMQAVAGA